MSNFTKSFIIIFHKIGEVLVAQRELLSVSDANLQRRDKWYRPNSLRPSRKDPFLNKIRLGTGLEMFLSLDFLL